MKWAFAALLIANVSLSFGPWLVRLADVGPVAAGFWRLAIGAPLLLLLCRRLGQPISGIKRAAWPMLLLAGLAFAVDLGLWHIGIRHTRLANAALFGNIASFFFVIYGFIILRRAPEVVQIVALLLAAAGVLLLVGRSYELSPQNVLGDILCIGAGLFYAVYLIAMDRVRGGLGAMPALAVPTLVGALPLLGFALLLGESVMPRDWTPLLLLAIGSQVIGQGLMVYAMGHLSPLVVGLGLLTQPAIAATIGWVAYGERLTLGDVAGALMIAVALILVRRQKRPVAG